MTSAVLLKGGENDGIAVYVTKETTLKEMVPKIEQVKSAFPFDIVLELSDTPGIPSSHIFGSYLDITR
jgi:hypothetical protein